jgi:surfactin synthase thioesterase subunit
VTVSPAAKMITWQAETVADFSLSVVDGDHFFYSQATGTVLKLIAADQAAEAAELSFR